MYSQLLGINALFVFFGLVLYVVFGQITVKRLRKDPATKEALGLGFASGWDILNVAQAISLPRAITNRLESSAISTMYANSAVLRQHTTRAERLSP